MPLQNLPDEIKIELKNAVELHQRAVSDYAKCLEFNKIMANLLDKLEDCGKTKLADKVMGILIECNPKEGSHCDQATQIGNRMNSLLTREPPPETFSPVYERLI